VERGRIIAELLETEHPEWKQQLKESRPSLSASLDSELIAWAEVASRKAIQLLKERKRRDT
jgi:hypothetical protein